MSLDELSKKQPMFVKVGMGKEYTLLAQFPPQVSELAPAQGVMQELLGPTDSAN